MSPLAYAAARAVQVLLMALAVLALAYILRELGVLP